MTDISEARATVAPVSAALYGGAFAEAGAETMAAFSADAAVRMCHPFGELRGGQGWWDGALSPLAHAWPDVERRPFIEMAGRDADGTLWLGACGNYLGTFERSLVGIPPTGRLTHMRFHEFFRIDNGQITEMQAIWDLPEVMNQAGVWPMGPSLGALVMVPAPATQDGLNPRGEADRSRALVIDMLTHLSRHPSEGGPEIMQAEKFWHPRVNWYGPAGIGTSRRIDGFRNWHQIPFLNGMPDRRGGTTGSLPCAFFAEGNYVAATGWPNMEMTLSGDGWLGIAPSGQAITMRSLDFWRVEQGLIRENWVLVDLLDVWAQLGVDVLGRAQEVAKSLGRG